MRTKILIQEIFYFLSVSLAVFFLMELIKPRIVLAYFNLSWLILAWLVFGILCLFISGVEE
jgi:hypothetical protein